ncbi:IS1249 family transposase [Dietzia timorensis]|nr:IS1249 family transposase [Dietzia timorensis]
MAQNHPACPICGHTMKRNGTTGAGTTRWRCRSCGSSSTKHRPDRRLDARFRWFIDYLTGTGSLDQVAADHGISRRTLNRYFHTFWYVQVPVPADRFRVYDQLFIDGTYTAAGCLLVAATRTHVVAWHWARRENIQAYRTLLEHMAPPLMVVIDGGQGAATAIAKQWPRTIVQRCLVHAQRNVRRHTTSRPRTDAGRAIYQLALQLTRITTVEQATEWIVHLNDFGRIYKHWLNEKTPPPPGKTGAWTFTHDRTRKAYNSLLYLHRHKLLFRYLDPPPGAIAPELITATTNTLEGGINAGIKVHAFAHRGQAAEHQRLMCEWWLYLKTEAPDDPLQIARGQQWGKNALAKAQALTHNENLADHETGRPALYDNAIEWSNSQGIQKGWIH